MKISTINAYKVTLPFKGTFSHSQKDARSVDNIVVEILADEQDLSGYGEGGPRPYVTGETQESAIRRVESLCLHESFPWKLNDVRQIMSFIDSTSVGKQHNSAICALEIALLDVLARNEGQNILHYFPKNHVTNEIRYGVTVPIAKSNIVLKICEMLTEFDIKEVRLKMGKDLEQNREALEAVRQVMHRADGLRVDVNGAWDLNMAKEHVPLLVSHGVSVLEQPLMPDDNNWKELSDILRTTGLETGTSMLLMCGSPSAAVFSIR
jgi:muconate cycloisomerase